MHGYLREKRSKSGQQTFSVKGQVACVAAIQLCDCGAKAATDDSKQMSVTLFQNNLLMNTDI